MFIRRVPNRVMRGDDCMVGPVGILIIASSCFLAMESLLTMGLNSERLGLIYGIIMGIVIKCYRFQTGPYLETDVAYEDYSEETLLLEEADYSYETAQYE